MAGAALALGNGAASTQDEEIDTRAFSEYYAELLSYAPSILAEAMKNGNSYERFKLTIKFAFSILHCMAL
jgi:glutamine synthetase